MNIYEQETNRKPVLLVVLCILTFIGSGLSFLSYLVISLSGGVFSQAISIYENMNMPEEVLNALRELSLVPAWKFLLLSLCYALAVVGAALMLTLNKIGFHLYTISQILLFICLNFVIQGALKMGVMGVIWSVVFISLYALQLRYMNPGNNNMDNESFTS